jgi:Icc-related predicted phosphoesterase
VTRLFFATDVHGSEVCWRKFLNAADHYGADVLVLGGDLTGKALVPLVHAGGDRWRATLLEVSHELEGAAEVTRFETAVARRGYYTFRAGPDEIRELEADEGRREALLRERIVSRLELWLELADERLAGTGVACFACPGNDDPFEIDALIASAEQVELIEGRVVEFGGYQMAASGWTNRTPWATYREEDEDALARRLDRTLAAVTAPPERTIYSLHCPPRASGLDDVPELDEHLRPRLAGQSVVPGGSTAVRRAIEHGQPLLSLHGHVHESRGSRRIGRSLSLNPGSAYEEGVLMGALVDLNGARKLKSFLLTSG